MNIPGELAVVTERIRPILLLASLVLALMQCYFGYKLLKFWITLAGFVTGFGLGLWAGFRFLPEKEWYLYLIALGAGILLGFLAFKLYLAGVFLFCGLLLAGAVLMVLEKFALPDIVQIAAALAAFAVGGILGVKFEKPLIIVITAVSGAVSATRVLMRLVPLLTENEGYALLAGMAIGGSGILLQFLMNKDEKRKRASRKD